MNMSIVSNIVILVRDTGQVYGMDICIKIEVTIVLNMSQNPQVQIFKSI